ncbi:MAG: o-succinylbenzoate--CoA ligase [Anaerolineae bacterium]|nr:o-succinylbenzoate--CoA ligase [Anaerolineae bacterium]
MMRDPLAEAAHTHPDAPALLLSYFSHLGRDYAEYSFARLSQIAARLAARLASVGAAPGVRLGLLLDHPHRAIELIHAAIRVKAVIVPLNTRLTAEELRHQIAAADCALVLCDRSHEGVAMEACGAAAVYNVAPGLGSSAPPLPDEGYFAGIAADFQAVEVDLDAVQAIVFTSGTTGRPKGAQITYKNWITSAQASAQRLGMSEHDRWLMSLPLYHVGGLSMIFRSCRDRSALVVPPPSREPHDLVRVIEAERVTLASVVPTQLVRMLDAGLRRTESLRLILVGGAAASPELLCRCCSAGLPVAPTYGLTEAASQVATMLPEDACRKPGSAGKAIGDTHIRILDASGALCSAGEIGEVVVYGSTVMKGYLGHPPVDPAVGFRTGDLGYLDDEGDLWIVQRRTDLIVTGGENVYPSEVEAVLKSHALVADACVVGIPDPEWGQKVAAMVVWQRDSKASATALSDYCRQHLAGYKAPRKWVFTEELPLTASGKVHRHKVAQMVADG